ncbi:hypothetical protein AAFF_G00389380 [Aldrovandia affinis]|uniref:Uncharacterized protein n=1 Tax=Aldrovandia affinis TaxID=143900 RepID=A0AAD7SEC3_9TELE|nr:hypothetical protein AAFF_G00389380 [Aldrovandia affinis]
MGEGVGAEGVSLPHRVAHRSCVMDTDRRVSVTPRRLWLGAVNNGSMGRPRAVPRMLRYPAASLSPTAGDTRGRQESNGPLSQEGPGQEHASARFLSGVLVTR